MRKPTGMGAGLFFLMGATLAVAAELPIAEPTEVGLSQERLDKITAVLEGDVSRKALPGDVLLIARHGKVAYLKALGARDPQANAAMSEDAIFRIYSMSKMITVAAALTLVEDGLVSLDDPIAK
jgi:CubicO group peptidase (beta-lactamase class C family)